MPNWQSLSKNNMLNQQTRTNIFPFSFATASLLTAASLLLIGFVLYVWLELATHSMFYSWAATAAFAAFFALPAVILLWRAPRRIRLALIGSFLLLILLLRNLDWNTRKPFLRGLDNVQVGMTAVQVDTAMHGLMRVPASGTSEYGTVNYRHTDEGWGNADVGVVTFKNGLVSKVEYLPD